jgi:transcriptional regulator with XRE-family HTH domain
MQTSEAGRILELLESLIVLKKVRLRDLEQSLGMSAGTLRRILNGRIELKFRHITDILERLDMPTRTFFKIAYETDDLSQAQSGLARAHRIAQVEPKPVTLSPSELEAVIVATIERLGLSVQPPDTPAGGQEKATGSGPAKKPRPMKKTNPRDKEK